MVEPYSAYLGRVSAEEDKVLFAEAVTCAQNGALRSAYILTWLSVAESFKRRFRDLARQDGVAGKIAGDVERKEANHQSVDMFLLDKAREYGLASDTEHTRLNHVYELRCVFGHPYEDAPTQELLVAAMADATDIVLARPAKLRQGFIMSQVHQITQNTTYLDDLEEAVHRYAGDMHAKVAVDLHGYVVESVLKELEPLVFDPALVALFRRGIWFVRSYVGVDLADHIEQWDVVTSLTRHPRATALAVAVPQMWPHLSDHARDMAVGELIKHGKAQGECAKALQELHAAGVMKEREAKRFTDFVSGLDPSYLASAGLSLRYYSSNIIDKLKRHDWYVQNPAIDVLENAGREAIAALPGDLQSKLGRNVLQAADGDANHAVSFLQGIPAQSHEWPAAFVGGVIEECLVNERGEVRFKTKRLRAALETLTVCNEQDATEILDDIAGRIEEGSVDDSWRVRKREDVIKTMDEMSGVLPQESMGRLRKAIADLDIPEDEW